MGCGTEGEATAPFQSLVKLQRWFLNLRMEDLPFGRTATLIPEFAVEDLPLGSLGVLVYMKDLTLGRII